MNEIQMILKELQLLEENKKYDWQDELINTLKEMEVHYNEKWSKRKPTVIRIQEIIMHNSKTEVNKNMSEKILKIALKYQKSPKTLFRE